MNKIWKSGIILIATAILGLSSCDNDDSEPNVAIVGTGTIADITNRNGSLTSLRAALKTASGNLTETLNGSGPFTLFAPDNGAFDALAVQTGFKTSDSLLTSIDAGLLETILTYHVVAGANGAGDLSEGTTLTSVQGGELTVAAMSADGEIQLLDATKLPETNPVSKVTSTNPNAFNGIVHVIDKVLLPMEAVEALNLDIRPTILNLATSNEDLSILVSALSKTNLVGTIEDLESNNVLAPTNEAFAALLEDLGDDYNSLEDFDNEAEITLLGNILRYHVLTDNTSLAAGQANSALPDNSVEVIAVNGGFAFGDATQTDANTISANVEAKNGFVQVIDKVLLPQIALDFIAILESDDLATTVANAPGLSQLDQALKATQLDTLFVDDTNESFVQGNNEEDDAFEERRTPSNFTYFKPATVFAPSDEAFADLFEVLGADYNSIQDFDTDDELELLSDILLYHVVSGKTASEDLMPGSLTTANESNIQAIASVGSGTIVIGDASNDVNANIIAPDVPARNGVALVIDKVLLPQSALDFIKSLNETEEEGN